MINANPDVKKALSKVKKTVVGTKNSANNSAILRNQAALRPQLPLSRRWTGECNMIVKLNRVQDDLVVVRRSEDADFEMGESAALKSKVGKLCSMLPTMKITTKAFQCKDNKLRDSWADLEVLTSCASDHKSNPDHKLCRCKLKGTCVGKNLIKHPSGNFARGAEKLQLRPISDVTKEERGACFHLREEVSAADEEVSTSLTNIAHQERREAFKRRKAGEFFQCLTQTKVETRLT